MDITLDIFNTPEGRSLEGKIKVPFIATLDWLDKMIFSLWFLASSQNCLVGLGKPHDEQRRYKCDYSWNRNSLGVDLKQNPESPACQYFSGDGSKLLVQIVRKSDPPAVSDRVLPDVSVNDYIFVEHEPGNYTAYDEDGKEHMVLVAHNAKQLAIFKRSNDRYDGYFTQPFLGVICSHSRAELEEELAERNASFAEKARHRCQLQNRGGKIIENVIVMAEDLPRVYVTLAGFYQCIMEECLPYDNSWLGGARLLNFHKVVIPMLNYRTILGFFVIDVEIRELSVYRMAGTERTIIDAHRHDIFTLMLRYIAGENSLTAFRAKAWRQNEFTIPGADILDFYQAVHRVLHV